MEFVITCMPGLAPLLCDELAALGLAAQEQGGAAVRLTGEVRDALRVSLWSRLAERVLVPVAQHQGGSLEAADALASAFDWATHTHRVLRLHVRVDHEPGVRGDSRVTRSRFLRYAPAGVLPADSAAGALCLRLQVGEQASELFVDLSGEALSRRGYRLDGGLAPLRETLAAAMLQAAGWQAAATAPQATKSVSQAVETASQTAGAVSQVAETAPVLIDPFCGSGTLLVEAAMMALNQAPGLLREEYALLHWPGTDLPAWQTLREEAREARRAAPQGLSLKGFDADASVLQQARANADRAGVGALIHFERRELGALRARDFAGGGQATGVVVTNPPWGERLEEQQRAGWLYHALGRLMARHAPQWHAVIVAGQAEALDRSGMATQAAWRVRNGPMQVYVRRLVPQRRAPVPPLRVAGETAFDVPEPAQALVNRLRKNSRQLRRWLDQSGVQAYRLYDRDLPEFNFSIDIYGDRALVQEYAPPKSIDEQAAAARRTLAVSAVRAALSVHREQVFLRTRSPQRGRGQYQKLDQSGDYHVVMEGEARLLINLRDYLDSGLFLDHRPMRLRLGEEAQGKRFLNLFGYTGAATVHAALGGASRTVTVDASRKYLDWAGCNLAANGFGTRQHELVRADVREWVATAKQQFDLIFCDPPTFSNNKSRDDFVVQRDHAELIRALMKRLEPGGVLYFSCNFRRFELDESIKRWYTVEDITRWSIPPDFGRNDRIHVCYRITHGQD